MKSGFGATADKIAISMSAALRRWALRNHDYIDYAFKVKVRIAQ
jgi:hypothetical protein